MKWFGGGSGKGLAPPTLQGKTIDVGEHRLRVEEHLGDGGFAVIYRVKDVKTGQLYALKHLALRSAEAKMALREEARIMNKVQGHPNVISLYRVAFGPEKEDEQDAFMLMDLCSESLYGYMQKRSFVLPDDEVLDIFQSVCGAVQHLHMQKHPICHRDIKIENVLKHLNGQWVLCDFGSAKPKGKTASHPQNAQIEQQEINRMTTPAYRAPEMWDVLMGHPIDERADIWALGCMLYLLSYGSLPFTGDSQLEVMAGKSTFPYTRDAAFARAIAEMLNLEVEKRPSIQTVLSMIEEIRRALAGGSSAKAVSSRSDLEPRSASATLKPTAINQPSVPQRPAPRSTLATYPSLPNIPADVEKMPNSARGAREGGRPFGTSFDTNAVPDHSSQWAAGNGKSVNFQTQHMKSTTVEEMETRKPNTPSVPKIPVSPALAGNNRPPEAAPGLADEVKSLKTTVGNLQEQNQLLWSRVAALENVVKCQQQMIHELQNQRQAPKAPQSSPRAVRGDPTEMPVPIAAPRPPQASNSAIGASREEMIAVRGKSAPPQQPAPPPASVTQDQPHKLRETAPTPKESRKTLKNSRFAGTFWNSVAESPQHQPTAAEDGAESADSSIEYENRHKRVVSDPPPLESWHTTGKL